MFTAVLFMALSVSTPDEEAAKAAVAVQIAKLSLKQKSPPVKVKTTCNCAETEKCDCWESQCSCSRCGLGGAVPKLPKASASPLSGGSRASPTAPTTDRTLVPNVASRAQPGPALGSFGLSPQTGATLTPVQGVTFPGVTSGCANGNCPSPTQSGGFFRRR